MKKTSDSVEFTQELSDPKSGYGYVYRKVVQLANGKPEMLIEQNLKNTGGRGVQSSGYNHNFVVLDKQPPGPDFTFRVPFEIQSRRPPNKEFAEIRENQVVFMKTLSGEDEVPVFI